jgi:hypothetical protein
MSVGIPAQYQIKQPDSVYAIASGLGCQENGVLRSRFQVGDIFTERHWLFIIFKIDQDFPLPAPAAGWPHNA